MWNYLNRWLTYNLIYSELEVSEFDANKEINLSSILFGTYSFELMNSQSAQNKFHDSEIKSHYGDSFDDSPFDTRTKLDYAP